MAAFESAKFNQIISRPTFDDWYIVCPDGRRLYFYGGQHPYCHFEGTSMEVFCPDWAPNVINWPHPGRVSQISVCEDHALFLTDDNKVYGTGNNQSGQRGVADVWVEDPGSSFTEIPIPTSDRIVQIETGVKSSFVLTVTGEVFTCGTIHPKSKPQRFMSKMDRLVFDGKGVTQISSGESVTTFLTEDGAVYVVGLAENPDAKGINASVEGGEEGIPVKIASLWEEGVRVNMISSGANHSVVVGKSVVTNETVVYGWGGNRNGALGENERGDVLRPILLTNIMAAISENGTVDEVVHVACGRFHTLLTLLSGRVLSVGAQNPYGQMGRSLPTSQYTARDVPVNSCDFMVLDRPVRAAFPGRQFSLLIPQESTAFSSQTMDNCSPLDEFSFGTCGLGGSGCLALYADDIMKCNNQPCRLQARFFSLQEAVDSASLAPTIPGTSASKKKKARKSEGSGVSPGPGLGPGPGPFLGQGLGQGRYQDRGLQKDTDVNDLDGDDKNDSDGEEDDAEDDELISLRLDFSDVAMSSKSMSSFQSLPKRLIPALVEAWSLPITALDLSVPHLLSQIEERLQARVTEMDNAMAVFSTKVMEQLEKQKTPRRLLPPQKKPPRYSLLIANHYNPVDLQHLVNAFSATSSATTSSAAVGAEEEEEEDHRSLLVKHVCQYMSELCFVSTSLYVESVDTLTTLGDLLRSPAHFPNFTTLRLELTSLCDPVVNVAVQEHGDMQPHLEDALFAAWITSLLHASSRGLTQQPSGIKQLQFAMMSQISGKTMRAIADALASHASPDRTVALETLSCSSIGLETDASEVYTAVHDVLALNLPSLQRLHLTDQNTTMSPMVVSLLVPALQRNTHLWQLWLSVSELGAEGVGLLGAQQLCEGIRGHVSPNECILFDIDISGDDGQPNVHTTGPAVNGPKLWKQWQTMIRHNSQNYLQFLQRQRQDGPPSHPALSLLEEPLMRHRQKKQTRRHAKHSSMTYVTSRERKWVHHVVKRPLDMSATNWEDEFDRV